MLSSLTVVVRLVRLLAPSPTSSEYRRVDTCMQTVCVYIDIWPCRSSQAHSHWLKECVGGYKGTTRDTGTETEWDGQRSVIVVHVLTYSVNPCSSCLWVPASPVSVTSMDKPPRL